MVEKLKSEEELRKALNDVFDELYVIDPFEYNQRPLVCTVCDSFVKPKEYDTIYLEQFEKAKHLLQNDHVENLDCMLKQDYQFQVPADLSHITDGILLSPRGTLDYDNDNGKPRMSICFSCKRSISRDTTPKFAISNGFFYGTPPQCLLDLTEIELAWITPVNPTYGLVFVYYGGIQKQLKGTLSYFKKTRQAIAVSTEKMVVMGLAEEGLNIVLVGSMTIQQKEAVKKKSMIRPNKIVEAVEWLVEHNIDWKCIDLLQIRNGLKQPIVIQDHSQQTRIEAESNIESSTIFRVYFPDSNLNERLGGQDSAKEFLKRALEERRQVSIHSHFATERVQDYEGRNLVQACLLQYPYGRGGMQENHSGTKPITTAEFAAHVGKISQSHFHDQRFILMMFNNMIKNRLVRRAFFQCNNNRTASIVAEDLDGSKLLESLSERRRGQSITNFPARRLMTSIDAITEAAPHSNQAARKARNKLEAMHANLGAPAWFLTVTPDDTHTILLNIYAFDELDLDLDEWEKISEMSDEDIAKRAKARDALRLSVPGICAWNFDNQIDAIVEHVIGWNDKKHEPTKRDGYFGRCTGYALSVEEQGRKSLHTHILVFVDMVQKAWSNIHNENPNKRKRSEEELCASIDRVSSSELIDLDDIPNDRKTNIFVHSIEGQVQECTAKGKYMNDPIIIGDEKDGGLQCLRNLRHKRGRKTDGGVYMICAHEGCNRKWCSEDIIYNYLTAKDCIGLDKLSSFPDNRFKRLKTTAMALIQNCAEKDKISSAIFEAGWNHHNHVPCSCFKSTTRNKGLECRYKYPKIPRMHTEILDTGMTTDWYKWDGTKKERTIFEPSPKRQKLDVFMNQNSPGIGRNKLLLGNTNIALVTPGAVANYVSKYSFKSTQDDDNADYNNVSKRVQISIRNMEQRNLQRKALEQRGELTEENKKKMYKSEALAAMLGIGFSLENNSTIGAPLASYLLRNESRFRMSHSTKWVAMDSIENLLNNQNVPFLVSGSCGYGSNHAYDYLCRPRELEQVSVFQFYSEYVVLKKRADEAHQERMSFVNTDKFTHPSWKELTNNNKGYFRASVRHLKPNEPKPLIQISRKWLLDTAKIDGDIRNCTINRNTEEYSKAALMLFFPFRSIEDLKRKGVRTTDATSNESLISNSTSEWAIELAANGSHTELLRYCIINNYRIGQNNLQYLQNFQDAIYNGFRTKRFGDELERKTTPYKRSETNANNIDTDDDEDATEEELVTNLDVNADEVLRFIEEHCNETCIENYVPEQFSTCQTKLTTIRKLQPFEIADMKPFELKELEDECSTTSWIESSGASNGLSLPHNHQQNEPAPFVVKKYKNILEIIVHENERILRTSDHMKESENIIVKANGSAESILEWSSKSKLDEYQREAFEIITAAFVLTFYDDTNRGNVSHDLEHFEIEKMKLEKLADCQRRKTSQIIALLHGPGGAGKSWVVEMVMHYAKEYTSFIEGFVFNKRTIIVTALTGSAATLIRGETLHGVFQLNKDSTVLPDADRRELFAESRLIIVDEISFASEKLFLRMNAKVQHLINEEDKLPFGGVNVVFMGDFRQLDPIGEKPLYYSTKFRIKINLYIELKGRHRFKDDPEWGEFLSKFRDGTITPDDIDELNEHLAVQRQKQLPQNMKYACFRNNDRDVINDYLFDKALDNDTDCLVVFASETEVRKPNTNSYKTLKRQSALWNNVSESEAKIKGTKRVDPVLKLYKGIRLLVTHNWDVENGIANGTQAYLTKVVLKPNETIGSTQMGRGNRNFRNSRSVLASQIEYIELKHHNDNVTNKYFRLEPKQFVFEAKIPFEELDTVIRLRTTQLPVVVNNATTGHKLQGVTVDSLFVNNWIQPHNQLNRNWNYVVLSRLKTREGLYSRVKLPREVELYQVPNEYKEMLDQFEEKKPSTSDHRHNFGTI